MIPRTLSGPIPFLSTDRDRDLSRDTVFEILRNERRRFTLHYLKREGEPVPVSELIDQIAAWENGKEPWEVSNPERQRVHVSMIQSHLPAMSEADLLEYDDDTGTVSMSQKAKELDIYLEIVPKGDIDWGEYYLGVALFNAVTLGLVWADLYPFGAIPDGVWLVFVPSVFLVAAVLHHWYQRKHQLGSSDLSSG